MAIILNIETATDIGSVCLSRNQEILAEKAGTSAFSHAKETTLMIDACLSETGTTMQDIDAVAVSSGPGSYTSLRIGTSIAKGICYALDKPLIAVDTLKSMALAATKMTPRAALYVPMIDARRMEVYTAYYDEALTCISAMHPLVLTANTFEQELAALKTIVLAGNGAFKIKQLTNSSQFVYTGIVCAAKHLVPLALDAFRQSNFEDIAYYQPSYLKPPNITTPKKVL